jgi:hypothetical protein
MHLPVANAERPDVEEPQVVIVANETPYLGLGNSLIMGMNDLVEGLGESVA